MRVASSIRIAAHDGWAETPPRLVLLDDQGDVMASIDLKDLAAALAPFLTINPNTKPE